MNKNDEDNMSNTNEDLLTINVHIIKTLEVKSTKEVRRMILFDGYVDCPNFRGKILPGGVDTQTEYPNKNLYLSARYILEGRDFSGRNCRLFIENNGTINSKKNSSNNVPNNNRDNTIKDQNNIKDQNIVEIQNITKNENIEENIEENIVPTIITDSEELKFLEEEKLVSHIEGTKDGVIIHILKKEN
ncbi:MAG: DUF3237 family protein [Lachnospiraceae bacterium]|nr:DUF3237 family protein [Lachnospiraceae bacterium]